MKVNHKKIVEIYRKTNNQCSLSQKPVTSISSPSNGTKSIDGFHGLSFNTINFHSNQIEIDELKEEDNTKENPEFIEER